MKSVSSIASRFQNQNSLIVVKGFRSNSNFILKRSSDRWISFETAFLTLHPLFIALV